jgi:aryl-alcohol dehydrogenase-like predicted oxidoreductase
MSSYNPSQVECCRLGKSGLSVSVSILGAMSVGHKDWQPWILEETEVFIKIDWRVVDANANLILRVWNY